MGGVRLRRISRLLPEHGWEPIVLTHPVDSAEGVQMPAGIRTEQVVAPDLTRLYRRLRGMGRRAGGSTRARPAEPVARPMGFTSRVNRWLMIPDKQVPWYFPALRRAREIVAREKIDAIFASQDPRTCLLVASRLSRETRIPCILEYRDLWTGSPYYHLAQATAFHRWLHEQLEKKALRQARRVSVVSRAIAEYLSQKYGLILQAPIELNYNFFDPTEYAPSAPTPAPNRPFTISYTGSIYGKRNPHAFFEGLRAFIDQTGLTPAQVRFRWAGIIAGIDGVDAALDRTRVRPYLDFLGQLPHREALRELSASDVSLVIQSPDDAIHIPGKLFEAMGARVPLLAMANRSETADLILRCRAGLVCPHTAETVAAALAEFHCRALKRQRWDFNEAEVQQFSAKVAVGKLAALFESVTQDLSAADRA